MPKQIPSTTDPKPQRKRSRVKVDTLLGRLDVGQIDAEIAATQKKLRQLEALRTVAAGGEIDLQTADRLPPRPPDRSINDRVHEYLKIHQPKSAASIASDLDLDSTGLGVRLNADPRFVKTQHGWMLVKENLG